MDSYSDNEKLVLMALFEKEPCNTCFIEEMPVWVELCNDEGYVIAAGCKDCGRLIRVPRENQLAGVEYL